MPTFFLKKDGSFVPCTVTKQTPRSRTITLDDGTQTNVHPEGVAWGRVYPRVFTLDTPPVGAFAYRGRSLPMQLDPSHSAVPELNANYRFQPFLSHVIDGINAGDNILLTGGTGVGKTTHITQLAARVHQPILRINFNGETRMSDLIGKVHVVAGETRWSDGVLPQAMRQGWWLLLDELDFADPAVLSLLHPVLEDDSLLVLKENSGEIVRPHPNFRLFGTANSIGAMQDRAGSYAGTNTMNEAFLDRWQVLLVDNLPAQEEVKVIRAEVPSLRPITARRIVAFANRAREKQMADGDFPMDNFSTRKVLAWARKTALHRSAITGARLSWLDKMPPTEQEVLVRILETHFGKPKVRPSGRSKKKVK